MTDGNVMGPTMDEDTIDLMIALTDAFERMRFPLSGCECTETELGAVNDRAVAWIRRYVFPDAENGEGT